MGSAVGSLAGAALGSFVPGVGTALGASLGGAAGSLFGGSPNVSGAYNTASGQQTQNAQLAQFRPVGITTNFGQSNFTYNPTTGQMESAGYTLSPQLQSLQSGLLGNYGSQLSQAQGLNTLGLTQGGQNLINLGNQYLATSPEQASADWLKAQQNLLAPSQEQQLAGIRNKLFQTGRTGLATGGTTAGDLQATNPEMAAYYNSLANTNRQLASQADQYGQQRTQFGQGLLSGGTGVLSGGYGLQSAAYSPLQTTLGLGSTIESMGAQPLDLSAQLGGRTAQYGTGTASLLNQSAITGLAGNLAQQGINATRTTNIGNQLTGLANNPKVSDWFSNLIGGNTNNYDYTMGGGDTSMFGSNTDNSQFANEWWM